LGHKNFSATFYVGSKVLMPKSPVSQCERRNKCEDGFACLLDAKKCAEF